MKNFIRRALGVLLLLAFFALCAWADAVTEPWNTYPEMDGARR